MSILVTFPGKYGDLLWALPTIRAISRRVGTPVDLLVAKPYASITTLIQQQPYIGLCASVDTWEVQDSAPLSPRAPQMLDAINTPGYALQLHLGYRGWPLPDVVRHTLTTASEQLWKDYGPLVEEDLRLDEPWITLDGPAAPVNVAVGFTDEHFELKYGVWQLVEHAMVYTGLQCFVPLCGPGSRWSLEAPTVISSTWEEHARHIRNADIFLGCCSALHVLAVAVGCPVVLMEPNPHRHNDVFYPLGDTGPQVTLVRGNDGLPTFDARHVADTLQAVLTAKETR